MLLVLPRMNVVIVDVGNIVLQLHLECCDCTRNESAFVACNAMLLLWSRMNAGLTALEARSLLPWGRDPYWLQGSKGDIPEAVRTPPPRQKGCHQGGEGSDPGSEAQPGSRAAVVFRTAELEPYARGARVGDGRTIAGLVAGSAGSAVKRTVPPSVELRRAPLWWAARLPLFGAAVAGTFVVGGLVGAALGAALGRWAARLLRVAAALSPSRTHMHRCRRRRGRLGCTRTTLMQ
eukprot:gene9952-biopygen6237